MVSMPSLCGILLYIENTSAVTSSRQLRWVISSCSLWETNGTVLSSLEDYPGVTHVISNGLHVISLIFLRNIVILRKSGGEKVNIFLK